METSLWNLKDGERGRILRLPDGPRYQRLRDAGIRPGTAVQALQRAPAGDPVLIGALCSCFALRRKDAEEISVRRLP